jgi:hypothetical protein
MLKGKLRYRIDTNHMYRLSTIYSSAVLHSCLIFKLRCWQNWHIASNSHICFKYLLPNRAWTCKTSLKHCLGCYEENAIFFVFLGLMMYVLWIFLAVGTKLGKPGKLPMHGNLHSFAVSCTASDIVWQHSGSGVFCTAGRFVWHYHQPLHSPALASLTQSLFYLATTGSSIVRATLLT